MITSAVIATALFAMALAFLRLILGPTQTDRVIAVEIVFSAGLVLVAVAAYSTGRYLFLDIAMGMALVGFVATIAWARLIDKSTRTGNP
jgi:multicomponent Na+:H+ antiporter subunit F